VKERTTTEPTAIRDDKSTDHTEDRARASRSSKKIERERGLEGFNRKRQKVPSPLKKEGEQHKGGLRERKGRETGFCDKDRAARDGVFCKGERKKCIVTKKQKGMQTEGKGKKVS